jgi:hypothetical protein
MSAKEKTDIATSASGTKHPLKRFTRAARMRDDGLIGRPNNLSRLGELKTPQMPVFMCFRRYRNSINEHHSSWSDDELRGGRSAMRAIKRGLVIMSPRCASRCCFGVLAYGIFYRDDVVETH